VTSKRRVATSAGATGALDDRPFDGWHLSTSSGGDAGKTVDGDQPVTASRSALSSISTVIVSSWRSGNPAGDQWAARRVGMPIQVAHVGADPSLARAHHDLVIAASRDPEPASKTPNESRRGRSARRAAWTPPGENQRAKGSASSGFASSTVSTSEAVAVDAQFVLVLDVRLTGPSKCHAGEAPTMQQLLP
jgi:hypothetical protein